VFDAKLSDPDMLTRLQGRQSAGLDVETVRSKKIGGLKSHAKILSIDGRVAVVGGLALTALSLEFRREIAIVVDDPSAMAQIEELFSAARGAGANAARSPA
jgi:phosphatidylserine/phosphatidylglycerophosphate/cardiolipin synthase-like enzyme